jgi:uncharacterized membrane protein YkvI
VLGFYLSALGIYITPEWWLAIHQVVYAALGMALVMAVLVVLLSDAGSLLQIGVCGVAGAATYLTALQKNKFWRYLKRGTE